MYIGCFGSAVGYLVWGWLCVTLQMWNWRALPWRRQRNLWKQPARLWERSPQSAASCWTSFQKLMKCMVMWILLTKLNFWVVVFTKSIYIIYVRFCSGMASCCVAVGYTVGLCCLVARLLAEEDQLGDCDGSSPKSREGSDVWRTSEQRASDEDVIDQLSERTGQDRDGRTVKALWVSSPGEEPLE